MVKMAAARAEPRVRPVQRRDPRGHRGACQELIDGKLHDQFRLDVFQGGAGTSTNMNANEVIANRALELMGHKKGEYKLLRPARSRERVAVHQRRLSRRRCTSAWRWATSRMVAAINQLIASFRAKGAGIRPDPEDGAHAAAGCRAR